MTIETERLIVYPISDDEIRSFIEEETDEELKTAYSEMLQGCLDDPENRLWYTVWNIALKSEPGTVVGDLCFKGLGADGMVEIGYGLREGFCGNGYMTEAVRAVCKWALAQNGVTCVESETDPDNAASQRVLENSGFVPTGTIGEEDPRFRLG